MKGEMIALVLPAEPSLTVYGRRLAESFLDVLPAPDRDDLVCALGEALANAVEHGSPLGGFNRVRLRLYRDPRRAVVEVKDEGTGFDPEQVPDPILTSGDPAALPERGFGVALMRRAAHAAWDEGGTRVRLTKLRG
jgi:serine/threonine-protein kinase RsbW